MNDPVQNVENAKRVAIPADYRRVIIQALTAYAGDDAARARAALDRAPPWTLDKPALAGDGETLRQTYQTMIDRGAYLSTVIAWVQVQGATE